MMAHIVSDGPLLTKSTSTAPALSRVDFSRQVDVYKLARRDGQCRRLWDDFAAADPGSARLVVSYVQQEQADRAGMAREVDAMLVKAEDRQRAPAAGAPGVPLWLAEMRDSCDPAQRETAWRELRKLGVL